VTGSDPSEGGGLKLILLKS